MKKIIILIFSLVILTTGCSSKPAVTDSTMYVTTEASADNSATTDSNADTSSESTASNDKDSASKTLEGEIKFYPTYDANYKTGSNEIFDFWFDIPTDWQAVDQSENGYEYRILSDNENIEIKMYGAFVKEDEDQFYVSLSGSNGTISEFTYRDGWIGKKINVSDYETYYVRVDGDSYMILHVNSKSDREWMTQNEEKINYIAMSARTTRESYGSGMEDENAITLNDLQLGQIKLEMTYDELLKVMGQKPEKEEKDDYVGMDAKTLFFADNTQIYMVDNAIYAINVTSPEYPTPRGLKTGDSVAKLKELYGEPANKEDENHWGYTYDGYELFTVAIENNKVVEIQIDVAM